MMKNYQLNSIQGNKKGQNLIQIIYLWICKKQSSTRNVYLFVLFKKQRTKKLYAKNKRKTYFKTRHENITGLNLTWTVKLC